MSVSVAEQQESLSDYGSDFTPDEEEILNDLLQQQPQEHINPITDQDLQLKDAQDEFAPRGARVRNAGYEICPPLSATKAEKRVTFQEIGDGRHAADSMLRSGDDWQY